MMNAGFRSAIAVSEQAKSHMTDSETDRHKLLEEFGEVNADTAYLDSPASTPTRITPFLKKPSFNAHELMAQKFPPLNELVPGLITSGLVLLVASPKIGKSWLMLSLSYAAATGSAVLGCLPVGQRPVLYMALEDGPRRLQNRLLRLGYTDAPDNLEFIVNLDRNDPLMLIDSFFASHKTEEPLVILDTYAKYRAVVPRQTGESEYDRDSRIASNLKACVDKYDGATLIIVHHTRKMKADDFAETVSGSQGTAGIADEIMKISRSRGQTDGLLQVSARDAAEGEYKIQFDNETGLWTLAGNTLADAASAAKEWQQNDVVGDLMASIIKYVNSMPDGVTPSQVDQYFGLPKGTAATYLKRAADRGLIRRISRGKYAPLSD